MAFFIGQISKIRDNQVIKTILDRLNYKLF
jgi:hypothetical protein